MDGWQWVRGELGISGCAFYAYRRLPIPKSNNKGMKSMQGKSVSDLQRALASSLCILIRID
jgi:hypothetical protein